MGQALYRKYRSKKLSEIVGQEHITKTLENALKSGKVSHAYLFTGPKGVGKTSIARILAHEINELPYTDESMHLDIIEIDAASNRRIDEIRDLRDKVHIAPTSAKYKVYIIDEVHMLTKEAFNALLKTLEEPPAHVVFILATTEIHKLPDTIVSRTQRFTFKAIDEQDAVRHLGEIARQEGMEVDEEALKLLATHGGGSFRDSISLLDQVGHSKKSISKADAEKLVGVAAKEHITGILHAVANGTPADILTVLDKLTEDGIAPSQATKQLTAEIRTMVVQGLATEQHVNLLADLLSVSASTDPRSQLEVALIRANFAARPAAAPQAATPQIQTESAEPAPAEPPSEALPAEPVEQPAESTETVAEDPPAAISTFTLAEGTPAEWWNDVLNQIKTINNTLYGVLRMAEASVADETLRLSFAFGFHQKKISDVATQAKIQEAVKTITGKMYRIEPVHDKAVGKAPQVTAAVSSAAHPEPAANPTGDISSITNIFGGGEVLES